MGRETGTVNNGEHMFDEVKVAAFGELLWDVLPAGPVLGGAPANFAFKLRSLGVPTFVVSRVGEDKLGQEALDALANKGMPLHYVQRDKVHPTGTVPVTLDAAGNPSFVIIPNVAYDYIESIAALKELMRESSLICFGTLVQRSERSRDTLFELLREAPRAKKVYDINLRKDCYSKELITASLQHSDVLKLNIDEVRELVKMFQWSARSVDDFVSELFEIYPLDICLVTLGAFGAAGFSKREGRVYIPGVSVKIVDTIGSGDAFTAGFAYSWIRGESLEECCRNGNSLGALSATTPGGMSLVTVQQLREFRARAHEEQALDSLAL